MTIPVRLQRRRALGASLAEASRAANGLEVTIVSRPGEWGSPFDFRATDYCWLAFAFGCRGDRAGRIAASVRAYHDWVAPRYGGRVLIFEQGCFFGSPDGKKHVDIGPRIKVGPAPSHAAIRAALASRNLACWCRLCPAHAVTGQPFGTGCRDCSPCHAMPLGAVANRLDYLQNGVTCEEV